MMNQKLLLLVVFCLFATVRPTTYFNREEGFFDNVFDGRETPDDYYGISVHDVTLGNGHLILRGGGGGSGKFSGKRTFQDRIFSRNKNPEERKFY